MRYNDFEGEGTPLVFVHGLGCASSFDYPQVALNPALRGRRMLLCDLIGSGYSDKPQEFEYSAPAHARCLAEFIDKLNLDKIILFGHSLGGAVALELYKTHPQKIERLILTESNLDGGGGSTSRAIARYTLNEFEEKGCAEILRSAQKHGNTLWAASLAVTLPRAAWLISQSAIQGGVPAWRDILYKADCPKTYIYGEKSLPDENEPMLKQHGVHIEVVPGAGHSMAWENPAGLAQCIYKGICL